MRKHLFLAAVSACAVIAPAAYGETIQIQYQIGSGAIVTCSSVLPGPVVCTNQPGPPLAITDLDANSNSPGTTAMSDETSSSLNLSNNSAMAQTIQIQVSANDFNAPVGSNVALSSHVGGTVLLGGASTFSYQSCIDPSNAIKNLGGGVTCPSGSFASGVSTPSIASAGAFMDTQSKTIALSGSYAIDEAYSITLAAGSEINWSASTTLTGGTATPEPNSLALAGLGLLGFSLLLKRVRRQA